jgi:hypothetical protein
MKKHRLFIIAVVTFLFFSSSDGYCQSEDLEASIFGIVNAYASKDNSKINNYVHPDKGLYFMLPWGDSGEYVNKEKLDFNSPTPGKMPYEAISATIEIKYEKLPVYISNTKKWDKKGLYCDKTNQYQLLSDIGTRIRNGGGVVFP